MHPNPDKTGGGEGESGGGLDAGVGKTTHAGVAQAEPEEIAAAIIV